MAQKRGVALAKTSAFKMYMQIWLVLEEIVGNSLKLILCLLDLIFDVFKMLI